MPYFVIPSTKQEISIGQNSINTFVAAVKREPGRTVKDYAAITMINTGTLKNVLRYTPEGAKLRKSGTIAPNRMGKYAIWETMPGTKLAPACTKPRTSVVAPVAMPKINNKSLANGVNSVHALMTRFVETSYLCPKSRAAVAEEVMAELISTVTALDEAEVTIQRQKLQLSRGDAVLQNAKSAYDELLAHIGSGGISSGPLMITAA